MNKISSDSCERKLLIELSVVQFWHNHISLTNRAQPIQDAYTISCAPFSYV